MAKTILGKFDYTYPHIDAPSVEDEEYRERTRRYKVIQNPFVKDDYRNPMFYYLKNLPWTAKRKYDGTNIRIKWDGEQAIVGGKTDKADLEHIPGLAKFVETRLLEERFEEHLGRGKTFYLFGEWMGDKVQDNELGLDGQDLVLFDVKVEDGVWFTPENVIDLAEKMGLSHFETYAEHVDDADDLDELLERVNSGRYADWEGIVCEPMCQALDRQGRRVICKIKNKDYYPEWKKRK